MIKRIVSSLLLTCFILWLIPMGQFIAKDRQSQACGGQRAFCMCVAHIVKKTTDNPIKAFASASQGANKEASSSGASNYFTTTIPVSCLMHSSVLPDPQAAFIPSLLFIRSIEHVPKI